MTPAQLASVVNQRPFRPFVLHLADSREIRVTTPEAFAYRGWRVALYIDDDLRIEHIDLLLVVSLTEGPARTKRTKTRSP
ncbi:MAG: hypothetical protein ACP5XB_10105 [Isosphaeraceae bacterium]